jgi:thiosulfate dehydrogenase [quinone] large subunit
MDTRTGKEEMEILLPERETVTVHRQSRAMGYVWGVLRLMMGWTFLWAFLDKAFGLGFATGRDPQTGVITFFGKAAWLKGGSPTAGLKFFAVGPFKSFYTSIAGTTWLDWLFMASLLLIGLGLLTGVMTRLAAIGGMLWMVCFYTATAIWPANNPFMDEHWVYFVALLGIAIVGAGHFLGLGKYWERLDIVKKYPILA